MSWNHIIDATRQYNEERVALLNLATEIRDRYYAFMESVKNHLYYNSFLYTECTKFKFVPEKSTLDKGFIFATSKAKFVVPTEYLLDPDEWESKFHSEIQDRYSLIRANTSAEFFASLGDPYTVERTEAGATVIMFRASPAVSVVGNSTIHRSRPWYYADKATGKIYENRNGSFSLMRAIADGTAIPSVL